MTEDDQKWTITDMGEDECGCYFAEISIGGKVAFEIQSHEGAEFCDEPAKRMETVVNLTAGLTADEIREAVRSFKEDVAKFNKIVERNLKDDRG